MDLLEVSGQESEAGATMKKRVRERRICWAMFLF